MHQSRLGGINSSAHLQNRVRDVDKDQIFSKFRGKTPLVSAEIEQFESVAGFSLPAAYVRFLRRHNGGEGFIGQNSYIILWKLGELAEMNAAYHVSEFAPGLFIFGSDGGGEAYAFDVRTSAMPIVSVPFVGMDLSLAQVVALDFNDFLATLSEV